MKKAISMMLALVMCLSLCACGNKNTTADYVGQWETKSYRLTLNKGGIGRYELVSDSEQYDLTWEVKDGVLTTQISFFGMEHKAVLELSEDGSSLKVIQFGFPVYSESEDTFTKK